MFLAAKRSCSPFALPLAALWLALLVSPAVAEPSLAQSGSCTPSWIPAFGPEGVVDEAVYSMVVANVGAGPELFLGGQFQHSGSQSLKGVARWTGSGFAPVGSGFTNGEPIALRVLPGSPAGGLHAVGSYVLGGGTARWNGTAWESLGSGVALAVPAYIGDRPYVTAGNVHDAGSGPELYVAGYFTLAGGQPVSGYAKWNGTAWAAVPPPPGFAPAPTGTLDLVSFDDGTGPALYAGGNSNGASVVAVARLGPGGWAAISTGVQSIYRFAVQDLGSGPQLFALGSFGASWPGVQDVALWNGSVWTRLNAPLSSLGGLGAHDFGAGPRLVASGNGNLSAWDGTSWQFLPGNLQTASGATGNAFALRSFDDGSGLRLFVGGSFARIGSVPAGNFARFDGTTWLGGHPGINGPVDALLPFHDGSGPVLIVGGEFTAIDGFPLRGIAKWDGATLSAVGGGLHAGRIQALAAPDLGAGRQLIAGGAIFTSSGDAGNGIQRWTGSSWQPLGSGIAGTNFAAVWALAEFDDGSGNALYVGGSFNTAGGIASAGIARWNGSSWSTVGGGGVTGNVPIVAALHVHDDGSGPALYAAGRFSSIGGVPATGVAKWNGTTWSAVSTGTSDGIVFALATHDDGGGPQLYAGGNFMQLAGMSLSSIARWDGVAWSSLGSGFTNTVRVMRSWSDASGPALLVGGFSLQPGFSMMSSWNGNWTTVATTSINSLNEVRALADFDDGVSRGLFVGGAYTISASGGANLTILGCPSASAFATYCAGDGSAAACPCGNSGAAGRGCASSVNPLGARLAWSGTASVVNADLLLEGSGMPDAACLYYQGTTQTAAGAGLPFGDGLRCAGGTVTRLGMSINAGGASSLPGPGEPALAQKGGVPIGGGVTRYYQAWYRNSAGFCTPSTFNLSNGLSVEWGP